MEHDRTIEILARGEGDIRAPTHSVPRASLDREERIIKETLLRMASLIEERIRLTVEALETHDAALALTVIEGDAEINAMQAEALDHIIRTIATQAPVARDLRFLLTLNHINLLLERTGDGCVTIAKLTQLVADADPDAALVAVLA